MKEYVVKVNGRSVFGCFLKETVCPVVLDLRKRLGGDAVITVEIVTTEPYDPLANDAECK